MFHNCNQSNYFQLQDSEIATVKNNKLSTFYRLNHILKALKLWFVLRSLLQLYDICVSIGICLYAYVYICIHFYAR